MVYQIITKDNEMTQPLDTTSNPDWFNATQALDLVPHFTDNEKETEAFINLCGLFMLTQGKEAGKRFAEVWLPWQKAALRAMFQRRESFLVLGKGSGKTVMVSAFVLGYVIYSALKKINTRGLVLVMGSSVSTANIAWEHILQAILADEDLKPLFKSNVQSRTLTHIGSGIAITCISPALEQTVGRRPILYLQDETHEFSKIRDSVAMANQVRQGGRNNGDLFKVINISTMPIEAPVGEMSRLMEYGQKVRDGKIVDPDFLPLLFTYPVKERPDLDYTDQATWWRGMPSLTHGNQKGTMDANELAMELETAAKAEDSESLSLILSQRLGIARNLLSDHAESILHSKWAEMGKTDEAISLTSSIAIGIDVGGIDDPLALTTITKAGNGGLNIWVRQYLTQSGYDRAKDSTKAVYNKAVKNKTLEIFPNTEDLDRAVFTYCLNISRNSSDFPVFGGDMYGRGGFKEQFEDTVAEFIPVPQKGYILDAVMSNLESLIDNNQIRHNHCPLMAFNVANLAIEFTEYGARRFKKKEAGLSGSSHLKVDGVFSTLDAVELITKKKEFDITSWMA